MFAWYSCRSLRTPLSLAGQLAEMPPSTSPQDEDGEDAPLRMVLSPLYLSKIRLMKELLSLDLSEDFIDKLFDESCIRHHSPTREL